MTEQIQELIDKIKSEGIEQAQARAGEIEREARKQADQIVQDARKKAERMIAEAEEEQVRKEHHVRAALQQAGRDMLLSLRKKIQSMLLSFIRRDVDAALSPEEVAQIINTVATKFLEHQETSADIQVFLKEDDLHKIKEHAMTKLKKGIKQPFSLRVGDDITGGFRISFDEGKSSFDFTDQSLVEYLSDYVNQEIARILDDAVNMG